MLQARTGSCADGQASYTRSGLPLVRSTSTSSCRLVSHLTGSPKRMIAMATQEVSFRGDLGKPFHFLWRLSHLVPGGDSSEEGPGTNKHRTCEGALSHYCGRMNHTKLYRRLTGSVAFLLWSTMSSRGWCSESCSIVTTF